MVISRASANGGQAHAIRKSPNCIIDTLGGQFLRNSRYDVYFHSLSLPILLVMIPV